MFDIIVIGGGTAGVLAALQCSINHPKKRIALFERRKQLLADLRPHTSFQLGGQQWTRVQLLKALADKPIEVYRSSGVKKLNVLDHPGGFEIKTRRAVYITQNLILACGRDSSAIHMLANLGLDIRPFHVAAFQLRSDDPRLKDIRVKDLNAALSWVKSGPPRKRIKIRLASTLPETQALMQTEGPINIQSGNLSGTVIKKLTSYVAKQSQPIPGQLRICINWIPDYRFQGILEYLQLVAASESSKTVVRTKVFELPGTLWSRLVSASEISKSDRWQDLMPVQFQELATQLSDSQFVMKPDLREARVTDYGGGVNQNNLHPDRPECKKLPGLYLVGSMLDNVSTEQGFSWIRNIGRES